MNPQPPLSCSNQWWEAHRIADAMERRIFQRVAETAQAEARASFDAAKASIGLDRWADVPGTWTGVDLAPGPDHTALQVLHVNCRCTFTPAPPHRRSWWLVAAFVAAAAILLLSRAR